MPLVEVLPWLVVVGCGLPEAAGLFLLWLRYDLNEPSFMTVMTKLLTADNRERALRLTRVVPHSPLVRVCRVALTSELSQVDEEAPFRGFRKQWLGRSFRERLEAELAPAIEAERRRLRRAWLLTLPGLLALPAVLVQGRPSWASWELWAAAVLALLTLLATRTWRRISGSLDRVAGELAPLLEQAPPEG